MTCPDCDEPILPTDDAIPCNGSDRGIHRECAVRAAAGSVGHQLGLCECHGKKDVSEVGMTRRQAARAALRFYRSIQ